MHIKEVVLEGFKSYANRTVVKGWDPIFNAITGFNGTGKSNILDAICWVMGISKTERMRVTSQKQLIYKEGQTRVTKASVSVKFDNSDKERSPIGYNKVDEITVTRVIHVQNKNKYYINGATAQAARVRDLFHSVSLDVNNPHFLIMQGMVTKVLNYGDKAILGMVEEAAGTKMYMEKKIQAEKTMKDKNIKMEEIEKILSEQINPQLDKLRREKQNFNKYQTNNSILQKNEKKLQAYHFWKTSKEGGKKDEEVQNLQIAIRGCDTDLRGFTSKIDEKAGHVTTLQAQLDMESNKNLQDIQNAKRKVEEEATLLTTQCKNKKAAVRKAEKKLKEEEKSQTELKDKRGDLEDKMKKLDTDQNDFMTRVKSLQENITKLEAQKLGIDSGDHGSLEAQLIHAKKTFAEAKAEMSGKKTEKAELEKDIKDKTRQAQSEKQDFQKLEDQKKRLEKQREQVERELKENKVDKAKLDALWTKMDKMRPEVEGKKEKRDRKRQDLRRWVWCNYDKAKMPKGFDHSGVLGMIADMIEVNHPDFNVALDALATGAMNSVVTRTSDQAALLVKKGNLKRRTNFFPLDRHQAGRGLAAEKIQQAKQLAGGDAWGVDEILKLKPGFEDVQPIIASMMGRTVYCRDDNTAQKVMQQLRVKTVSCTGSVYSPTGEISGGARSHNGILVTRKIAKDAQKDYEQLAGEFNNIRSQHGQMESSYNIFERSRNKLENITTRLNKIDNRLSNSQYSRLMSEAKASEETLKDVEKRLEALEVTFTESNAEVKKLQKSIRDFKQNKAAKMKEIATEIKRDKKALKSLEKQKREEDKKKTKLRAEIEAADSDLKDKEKELGELQEALKKAQDEHKELSDKLEAAKKLKADWDEKEKEEREKIASQNREIAKLKKEINALREDKQKLTLEKQEKEEDFKNMKKSQENLKRKLEELSNKFPWIDEEKENFGKPGHESYDFNRLDVESLAKEHSKLKAEQEKLDRTLNKKVMHMLDGAEREFKELRRKRETVKKDREKIEKVIRDLDTKKTRTLQECFTSVNKNFGKIFAMLLPGSTSKLVPKNEEDGLESGIEIKVAFGGTWKESLSELSGGQRSLLALSLILAIAAKNPAPIYILDEIDAALDPSHTQNVGAMLQQQFRKSQFIIVSLKDGMFDNANVLFRTEFVDGVSQVRKVRGYH